MSPMGEGDSDSACVMHCEKTVPLYHRRRRYHEGLAMGEGRGEGHQLDLAA